MSNATSNIPASAGAIQVPINTLPALMQRLAAFLSVPGVGTEPAAGLIRERLHANCVQCGQIVSAPELAALADGSADPGTGARRVARLKRGYCVREGCNSLHYELRWETSAGEGGRKVEDFLQGKISSDPATRDVKAGARWGSGQRKLFVRLAIGDWHWRSVDRVIHQTSPGWRTNPVFRARVQISGRAGFRRHPPLTLPVLLPLIGLTGGRKPGFVSRLTGMGVHKVTESR